MVNQDYGKFYEAQKNHKSQYLGGGVKLKKDGSIADPAINDKETVINPGAEGRNDHLRGK